MILKQQRYWTKKLSSIKKIKSIHDWTFYHKLWCLVEVLVHPLVQQWCWQLTNKVRANVFIFPPLSYLSRTQQCQSKNISQRRKIFNRNIWINKVSSTSHNNCFIIAFVFHFSFVIIIAQLTMHINNLISP